MVDFKEKEQYDMADLVRIVAILRQPDGCPWDKEQTHESIRQNFIEETYEAIEAIDLKDEKLLCEELGDVLLQVVFHSQMEAEKGNFSFAEVCDGVCKKLVYRHPHVFGELEADEASAALENWEKMKNAEKGRKSVADRLDSVPVCLPALMRAAKTQKRAEVFGIKQKENQQVLDALQKSVEALPNTDHADQAVGDMLMCAVAVARCMGIEPEEALYHATDRFSDRVKACERQAAENGQKLNELNRQQLAELWSKSSL